MAQRQIVLLTDDLDGKELTRDEGETVTFALDGINYEIDLGKKNAQTLRDTIGKYIDKGRKVSGSRSSASRTRRESQRDYDPAAVRAWAKSNKKAVPERGRIPSALVEEFKAAGN